METTENCYQLKCSRRPHNRKAGHLASLIGRERLLNVQKKKNARSENEKRTCKNKNRTWEAWKSNVFHRQICKFLTFLLPSSSCFLKFSDNYRFSGEARWLDSIAFPNRG